MTAETGGGKSASAGAALSDTAGVPASMTARLPQVRDLLLTGRSFNVTKAQQIGLVSQVTGEGEALRAARAAAAQAGKFDRETTAAAKKFIKPIPYEDLKMEIDIFCGLFTKPAVEAGLRKFVESTDALPYLP